MRTLSIRIAFRNNRFGAAATMRDIFSGNEQEGEGTEGGRRAARAGKLISLYRECSQHEPYAAWLTSFHELKVSASRCGLRYRADYYIYGAVRARMRGQERTAGARKRNATTARGGGGGGQGNPGRRS